MTLDDASMYLKLWGEWQEEVQNGTAPDAIGHLRALVGGEIDPESPTALSFNAFAAGVEKGISFCVECDKAAYELAEQRRGDRA